MNLILHFQAPKYNIAQKVCRYELQNPTTTRLFHTLLSRGDKIPEIRRIMSLKVKKNYFKIINITKVTRLLLKRDSTQTLYCYSFSKTYD